MTGLFVGLSKLVLGIATALLILSLAGVATARYFMARLSVLPPKPVFDNELPAPNPEPQSAPQAIASPTAAVAPDAPAAPATQPEASEPQPEAQAELEPGAYKAIVVQPIGLVLREGPGTNYGQIGGIDYNQAIVVLEKNPDQAWIRIRVVATGQEGWVKAGNTKPVNDN